MSEPKTTTTTPVRTVTSDTQMQVERACPGCGQTTTLDAVRSPKPAEQMRFAELQESWSGFFKEKTFYSFRRCVDCGVMYCPQYFSADALSRLYGAMSDNTAGQDRDLMVATQRDYFQAVERAAPLEGGYLEIGPDIGLFTQCCVDKGNFDRYWLFEPNAAVHNELSGVVSDKAHDISTSLHDLSAVPNGSIRLAVMIHVLDHMTEPLPFLRDLRAKMAPDGVLTIVTHNERSLLARILGWRWPAYCLQHPQLYNPRSIEKTLSAAGFRLEQVRRTVNYFPFMYLLQHLAYAVGLEKLRLPKSRKFVLALKLGNIQSTARPA